MPEIIVIDINGDTQKLGFTAGATLMELLRDHDYEQIAAICGGCCSCATCHVHIAIDDFKQLPPIEEDEQILIEYLDEYEAEMSRLSCQIELSEEHDGLKVTIVETE
jgi:2Fe-2S ferredoxin